MLRGFGYGPWRGCVGIDFLSLMDCLPLSVSLSHYLYLVSFINSFIHEFEMKGSSMRFVESLRLLLCCVCACESTYHGRPSSCFTHEISSRLQRIQWGEAWMTFGALSSLNKYG